MIKIVALVTSVKNANRTFNITRNSALIVVLKLKRNLSSVATVEQSILTVNSVESVVSKQQSSLLKKHRILKSI